MKRFSALFLPVLFAVDVHAQERPAVPAESEKKEPPAAGESVALAGETRMRALEEQVRTLAEQVALLRGELKAVRETKPADPATGSHVLLTSERIEPGMLPSATPLTAAPLSAPQPLPPQIAQTQPYPPPPPTPHPPNPPTTVTFSPP